MNIVIFGPNGSGKGTQSAIVRREHNLVHIESGAIFRKHIDGGTELGKKAKAYIDYGNLVPDDITIPMVLETLKEHGQGGWLLDGFPRNITQAKRLWQALQSAEMGLDYVVEILLSRELARSRLVGRRLCVNDDKHPNNSSNVSTLSSWKCWICGGELKIRSDDQDEAAINKRHDIYYDVISGTLAACHFFKSLAAQSVAKYIELNGDDTIDAIKEKFLAQLV